MPTPHPKRTKDKKVRVKREPTEVKPLSNYVDDPLELIKQAFSCLKPKTIKGITPQFLQKESLESIQEQCLDEVLGISKKRLLSIINDTKCPSDTESSDDDIVEHISMEEISSDEDTKPKVANNRTKKPAKSKATVSQVKAEKQTEGEKKEYSVLELLELQARARAIRSQLALEPVTKIELDGDDDDEPEEPEKKKDEQPPKKKRPEKKPESPRKKDSKRPEATKSSAKEDPARPSNGSSSSPTKPGSRTRRVYITGPDYNSSPSSSKDRKKRESSKKPREEPSTSLIPDAKVEKLIMVVTNDRSRDSSPDVEPILPESVTLCISSSEDEEEAVPPKCVDQKPSVEEKKDSEPAKPVEDPEEGEIDEESAAGEEQVEDKSAAVLEPEEVDQEKETTVTSAEKSNPVSSSIPQPKDDVDVLCVQLDDDCIDLECNDLIEEDEVATEAAVAAILAETVEIEDSEEEEEEQQQDAEKDGASKSWGERWLGSSKVTKILATSKLGNQVRRKIQMSKKKKEEKSVDSNDGDADGQVGTSIAEERQTTVAEEAEVGSIEHYNTIVGNAKAE